MIDRSQFRTKSIGVRVCEADFNRLQQIADASGKPLGEWCRDVLLEIARHPIGSPIEHALLAELIGLRTIVGNLLFAFTSEGKVTHDQMAGFVERADSTKLKRALELLKQVQNGQANVGEPQVAGGER
jgi:hypothetical protein